MISPAHRQTEQGISQLVQTIMQLLINDTKLVPVNRGSTKRSMESGYCMQQVQMNIIGVYTVDTKLIVSKITFEILQKYITTLNSVSRADLAHREWAWPKILMSVRLETTSTPKS